MRFKIPNIAIVCEHKGCPQFFQAGEATLHTEEGGGGGDLFGFGFGGGGGNTTLEEISGVRCPNDWKLFAGLEGFPKFFCSDHKAQAEELRLKTKQEILNHREKGDCRHSLYKQYVEPLSPNTRPWICVKCFHVGEDDPGEGESSAIDTLLGAGPREVLEDGMVIRLYRVWGSNEKDNPVAPWVTQITQRRNRDEARTAWQRLEDEP